MCLDSVKSSSSVTAPKSLREWHEQPVNLSEQPPLIEKVNVQILSPNSDRVNKSNKFDRFVFFFYMKIFFLDNSSFLC